MMSETEYPLDERTRSWIAECNAQIHNLATQMNGALNLICRQNGLPGQWRLAPDGTKLVRIDQPQPEDQGDFTKKSTNGTRKPK
jgi:hypothetical protein